MKKLKPHTVDWAQIDRFLASADKKLASAHEILAFDEEACLQQAYEAMLKASTRSGCADISNSAEECYGAPSVARITASICISDSTRSSNKLLFPSGFAMSNRRIRQTNCPQRAQS